MDVGSNASHARNCNGRIGRDSSSSSSSSASPHFTTPESATTPASLTSSDENIFHNNDLGSRRSPRSGRFGNAANSSVVGGAAASMSLLHGAISGEGTYDANIQDAESALRRLMVRVRDTPRDTPYEGSRSYGNFESNRERGDSVFTQGRGAVSEPPIMPEAPATASYSGLGLALSSAFASGGRSTPPFAHSAFQAAQVGSSLSWGGSPPFYDEAVSGHELQDLFGSPPPYFSLDSFGAPPPYSSIFRQSQSSSVSSLSEASES